MPGSHKSRAGGVLFGLGVYFNIGFICLAIPPLLLAINSRYTVDATLYDKDGTFVSLSRSKGILFECLEDPGQRSLVTQTLNWISIWPGCAMYDLNIPISNDKRSDNSKTISGFRMAYAITYVAGLLTGIIAFLLTLIGGLAFCCLKRKYETAAAFADLVTSIGAINATASILYVAGCALYAYERLLEVHLMTEDFQFTWANLNQNLRNATTVQIGSTGIILMWVAVLSNLLASFLQLAAGYHLKPRFSNLFSQRVIERSHTNEGYNEPDGGVQMMGVPIYPGVIQSFNGPQGTPERPPRAFRNN